MKIENQVCVKVKISNFQNKRLHFSLWRMDLQYKTETQRNLVWATTIPGVLSLLAHDRNYLYLLAEIVYKIYIIFVYNIPNIYKKFIYFFDFYSSYTVSFFLSAMDSTEPITFDVDLRNMDLYVKKTIKISTNIKFEPIILPIQ